MSEETKPNTEERPRFERRQERPERTNDRDNDSRDDDNSGDRGGNTGGFRKKFVKKVYYRKKECFLCKDDKIKEVDYKNIELLRRYISEKGKIIPRRMSGNCAKCQRAVARAIKRARNIALLPFTRISK
jgi:small subunit ribosomal protein S18